MRRNCIAVVHKKQLLPSLSYRSRLCFVVVLSLCLCVLLGAIAFPLVAADSDSDFHGTAPIGGIDDIHIDPLEEPLMGGERYDSGDEDGRPLRVVPDEFSISWFAPILSQSGYGKEAIEYLLPMDASVERFWNDTSRLQSDGGSSSPLMASDGGEGDAASTQRQIVSATKAVARNLSTMPSYVACEQHGDALDPTVLQGYPSVVQAQLRRMLRRGNSMKYYGISGLPRHQPEASDVSPPPVSVAVCHSEPGAWAVPRPLYETSHCPPWYAHIAIGRTMFETDRIPLGWVERIKHMDELWVPSAFHVETFASVGVPPEKLVVIPESIDVSSSMSTGWGRHRCGASPAQEAVNVQNFFASVHRKKLHQRCGFKFLSIFKWEERKGWDVLIRAFYEEFIANEESSVRREDEQHPLVCLVMKTTSYHDGVEDGDDDEYDDQISEFLTKAYGSQFRSRRVPSSRNAAATASSPAWLQMHVMNVKIDASVLPLFYCGVDALVQPSRGEGWGRPHMEAMAMEVPVVATNWSGTTAFLNDGNAWPIAIEDELREIRTGSFKGHRWAEPRKDHLRRQMRNLVRLTRRQRDGNDNSAAASGSVVDGDEASLLRRRVQRARDDVVTLFNGPRIADMMLNRTRWLVQRACERVARAPPSIVPTVASCAVGLPTWDERWAPPALSPSDSQGDDGTDGPGNADADGVAAAINEDASAPSDDAGARQLTDDEL